MYCQTNFRRNDPETTIGVKKMGQVGIWQIVIIAVVVVLLFGRGKISDLMGDVAKGITSFKKGLKEEEAEVSKTIEQGASETVASAKEKSAKKS
jgi:sec-independent protein translocase protein TatA